MTPDILDGAMGSEIIKRGVELPKYIWSAWGNTAHPNLVKQIHDEYIKSGCNYITTNTFRTTQRAYIKTGVSAKEAKNMAFDSLEAAVSIAIESAKKKIKVLGSIAPLEDCYIPDLYPGYEKAKKEFSLIGKALIDAGVDGLILETMNSISETIACLESIKKHSCLTWVSFNLKDSHHLQSGERLDLALNSIKKFNVDCILLNCNELNRTKDAMKILANNCSTRWGIYPNLGLGEPSPDGVIDEYASDEEFLSIAKEALDLGANVLGACCGSSPKHINLIKNL